MIQNSNFFIESEHLTGQSEVEIGILCVTASKHSKSSTSFCNEQALCTKVSSHHINLIHRGKNVTNSNSVSVTIAFMKVWVDHMRVNHTKTAFLNHSQIVECASW
jgi:hypothetical protein